MPALRKPSEGAPARAREGSRTSSPVKGRSSAADTRKTPTPAPAAPPPAPPDDYAVPLREVVKPPGQLQLNEKELAEEVGRTLTAANPSAPANVVRYSYRERGYRPEPLIDQLLHHFSMDGCLIHQESEEVLKDRQRREAAAFAAVSRRVTAQSRRVTAQSRRTTHSQLELPGGVPIAAVVAAPAWESPLAAEHSMLGLPPGLDDEGASATVSAKQLRNQFNFTDRGAMTTHGLQRTHSTMTEAPPTATASGSCTCWEIFDAFIDDQERQRQQEEAAKLKAAAARRGSVMAGAAALASRRSAGGAAAEGQGREAEVQAAADGPVVARVVERMMQQNVFKDVVMDFKYWDDPADLVRPQEGTLLPLWSFTSLRVKQRAVTALAWSPKYFDLFAVGYGSYDFHAPTTGLVCCYSLKSPSRAERTFALPTAVLCLDFHPEHPNLLAVGCYDGSVMVFDVRAAETAASEATGTGSSPAQQPQQQPQHRSHPLFVSTARNGKHTEPVWQVCWQRTDSHELEFCSVSSDGRVTLWTVSKNELSFRDLLSLRQLHAGEAAALHSARRGRGSAAGSAMQTADEEVAEDLGLTEVAAGCCLDFHRSQDYLYMVGTEEGGLFKCSTTCTTSYLSAFAGHTLPIYAVRWNSLHPRAFLSASADWTVKLWDTLHPRAVMSFDLGSPVGDTAWAPFSSTVFAAVTEAGRVHVFDLAQNRSAAVCMQRAAKKARLTRLAFNPRHPVLLVGDDQGGVTCFKLSPNLRKGVLVPAASGAAGSSSSAAEGASSGSSGGDGKGLSHTASRRAGEAERLEAVLAVAHKCNQAMTEADWELL